MSNGLSPFDLRASFAGVALVLSDIFTHGLVRGDLFMRCAWGDFKKS